MKRTTIKDIAREAGVSVGAASFALNDRPGVSEATRERVKQVAAQLGWQRSAAAAALSGRQAGAMGMVMRRGIGDDFAETFVLRFMAGMDAVLRPLNQSIVLQLVTDEEEEIATYRRWWGERRVDGVVLMRPTVVDGRRAVLAELGLPGVAVGGPMSEGVGSVSADEAVTTNWLVDHFADLGHRRIAFVTGPIDRWYIKWRCEAFEARCQERGIEGFIVHTDVQDEAAGIQGARDLLRGDDRPTAVLYDNELLAIGGIGAIDELGLRMGRDISVAVYEDSPALRMHHPAVTALRRKSENLGKDSATSLLDLVGGGRPKEVVSPLPELVVRGSSGAPAKA